MPSYDLFFNGDSYSFDTFCLGFVLLFGSTGVSTEGLAFARQALYHLSQAPSPLPPFKNFSKVYLLGW
jgi:hypothetical protein